MAGKVKNEMLFVEPEFFGKGTGGKLLNMTVLRPMAKSTLFRYQGWSCGSSTSNPIGSRMYSPLQKKTYHSR